MIKYNKIFLYTLFGFLFGGVLFFVSIPSVAAVTYLTPSEITPGTASSWVDVDVSASVPSGATGVILHINNSIASGDYALGFRKNGSTDNRTNNLQEYLHMWTVIGVDSSRILEMYIGNTTYIDIYLVGYFTSEAVFFTNATDKSFSTYNTWIDIDISSDTGSDTAIGAFIETIETGNGFRYYGFRKNGSTDNLTGGATDVRSHVMGIAGTDGSEIFEGYAETNTVDFFLTGYMTAGAVFYTNATDVSPGSTTTWTDFSALPSGANGGIYQTLGIITYDYGLRKNGSSESILYANPHAFAIVEADTSRIVEGYREHSTYNLLYEIGYTTTLSSNSTPTISSVTDAPDPVAAGVDIYWNVDWSDSDTGDMIKVFVCTTNAITAATPACSVGTWAESPVFTNRDPEGLAHYTTTVSNIGSNNYYVFVCDDSGDSGTACSTSSSGSFTVQEQSPTAPTDLLLEQMPNPVNIATTTPRFSAVFNDPNIGDIANKYCIHVNTSSDFSGTNMWVSDGVGCGTGSSLTNCAQGNRCQDIYYNGTALSLNDTVYYWRVNFWDDSGNVSASSTIGNFTMANNGNGVQLQGSRINGGVQLK